MAASKIDTILSELGWKDGFRIPVANQENRRLEDEIQKMMKLRENLSTKLHSTEERLATTKKHCANLAAQHETNQKLLTAHSAQLQTEDHRYRLSCCIESNLKQEARNFEKEWKEVNDAVSIIENDLHKVIRRIDTSKKAIKFDEATLQSLEDALNKNVEDNQLIQKYMKEDTKTYKELELERQKLSTELVVYRQAIIRATVEAREMELVLDQTAKLYNEAIKEGQNIFNQWKDSVAVLQQRDNDIDKVLREIEALTQALRERKNAVQEAEQFFQDQIEANKVLKGSIKQLEKKLAFLKQEQIKIKDTIQMYETEVRAQKNIVKELAQKTQQLRCNIRQKQQEIESRCVKIESMKKQIARLTKNLHDIDNQALNIEEKTKELEQIMEEQEKRKITTAREISRLQASNLRGQTQMKELENEIRITDAQHRSELKKSECLSTAYKEEERILEQRKEALHHAEFELQKAELKLERLRGNVQDESEAERKQKKVEELQNILNEKNEIAKLLQKQTTNLEYDTRKLTNTIANDNSELERLRNKKQDLLLLVEGGEKQVKAAQNRNEEKLVEKSLLCLKVSQMEKMINALSDNVYNLERCRLELDAAIDERKAEIAVQEDSLVVQKRVISSECSELRNAIAERKARIRQLQNRYENGIAMMGKNPDGTAKSTTYLKIQSAQEKYLLQEQGDKLDESIRKAEEEIQSMENTLRVINACNDKYKSTLNTEGDIEAEQEQQRKLEQELLEVESKLKTAQEHLTSEQENLLKLESTYSQVLKDIERVKDEKEEKERHLADLEQQIAEQKGKILRADKSLRIAQKDIRNLYCETGDDCILLQEKEVQLRDLRERNAAVLQDIAEFTIRNVEAEAYVKKLLDTKNIELPSISLLTQPGISSQSLSAISSTDLKSTGRTSAFQSSRGSIGSVVNIEAQLDAPCNINVPERDTKVQKAVKCRQIRKSCN